MLINLMIILKFLLELKMLIISPQNVLISIKL